jgi:predicted esterase
MPMPMPTPEYEKARSMPAPVPNNRLSSVNTPVLLHHAVGDKSTAYSGSANLAEELKRLGKSHRLRSYPGNEHFLTGEQFETAVARDIEFFRSRMRPATAP